MRAGVYGVAVGLMALVGCSGGSGGGGYSSVTIEQLPQVYAKVLCEQNFKCASTADIMGRTKQDCLDTNQGIIQLVVPEIRDSVTKGRETYDPVKAGACMTALQNMSCDDWVKGTVDPPACADVVTPKVALGGACAQSGDCIGGYCDGATTDPPKDGVCKATIAHGGQCTLADTCAGSDVCDSTTMTCTAKKAGGEPCTDDFECSNSCNPDTSKCSGYAGCNVSGVTPRSTLLSLLAVGLVVAWVRRRRSP